MADQIQTVQPVVTIVTPALAPKSAMPDLRNTALEEQRLDTGRNSLGNAQLAAGIVTPTVGTFLHAARPATNIAEPVASEAAMVFANENQKFATAAKAPIENGIKADTSIGAAEEAVRQQTEIINAFRRAPVSGAAPAEARQANLNKPSDPMGIANDDKPAAPTYEAASAVRAAVPGVVNVATPVMASATTSGVVEVATAVTASTAKPGIVDVATPVMGRAIEATPAPVSDTAEPRRSPLAALAANVLGGVVPEILAFSFGRKAGLDAAFADVQPGVAANGNRPAALAAEQQAQPAIGYMPAVAMADMDRGEKIAPAADNDNRKRRNPVAGLASVGR